uniref:Uncharacterized protein n=1 Tax=Anguilla anguilla TaxID=7936 RepID=A0A0E9QAW8_ANGAN
METVRVLKSLKLKSRTKRIVD